MDNASESTPGRPSLAPAVVPLAATGALAVAAALATYFMPARRSSAAAEKQDALIAYLRDHLAGAGVAIEVVRRLASTEDNSPDGHLFRHLWKELEQDRATAQSLLSQLGASSRSPKRTAGSASGRLLGLVAGGKPGDLSLLRTLEALAIGIQGKRCMWRALQELGTGPSTGGETFAELEARAVRQWERVEQRRRALAAATFPALGSSAPSRVE